MLYNLLKYSYCLHIFHIKAQVDKNKLSYTEKQDKTGRPVSPHVTIYKFPVTALSSITNRVTGVGIIILLLCWFYIFYTYVILFYSTYCRYHRYWCCFIVKWWCSFINARYLIYVYIILFFSFNIFYYTLAIGSSAIGPLAKIAVSFPLIYHYLGGVRHIVWDKQPETHINNESVEKSR